MEYNEEVVRAVQTITNAVNRIGRTNVDKSISEALRREHRTLQQGFWNAILKVQIAYADAGHDLRNEQAVKLAGAVKELARANNWDMGLPLI